MSKFESDVQSLATFLRHSSKIVKHLEQSNRPVVLTVRGKAVAVVQDPEAYRQLLDIAARADAEEAIRRGWTMLRMDSPAGRVKPSTKFAANMTYRVELTDRAARDREHFYLEKNASKSQADAGLCSRREEASPALEGYPDRLLGRGDHPHRTSDR